MIGALSPAATPIWIATSVTMPASIPEAGCPACRLPPWVRRSSAIRHLRPGRSPALNSPTHCASACPATPCQSFAWRGSRQQRHTSIGVSAVSCSERSSNRPLTCAIRTGVWVSSSMRSLGPWAPTLGSGFKSCRRCRGTPSAAPDQPHKCSSPSGLSRLSSGARGTGSRSTLPSTAACAVAQRPPALFG